MGASCNIDGLVKRFGERPIVDHVSLDVAEGEFLVILGPSGCGKTTTLRMVAGLETPDAGTVAMGGRLVSDPARGVHVPPERRDIGMVFQSYAVWPHMTVFENVAFPLRARRLARGAALRGRVEEVLRTVGLPGLGARPASALSGGQMQRVVLARAMVYGPQIMLFDEPLSNLDQKMREHLRVELKALQARTGLTCIYVTHDQVEAVELADRIAVMEAGRVVQLGPAREIYRRPATRFVAEFISSANIFPGRVVESRGPGLALVRTEGGRSLVAGCDWPVSAGEVVDVVVHPEECAIDADARDEGDGMAVRVLQCRFQGVSLRYTVDWGGAPLDVVMLGTAEPLAPGTAARLRLPDGQARALPAP